MRSEGVVDVPNWVDVERANATYDNGIMVLILPTAPGPRNGEPMLSKWERSKGAASATSARR